MVSSHSTLTILLAALFDSVLQTHAHSSSSWPTTFCRRRWQHGDNSTIIFGRRRRRRRHHHRGLLYPRGGGDDGSSSSSSLDSNHGTQSEDLSAGLEYKEEGYATKNTNATTTTTTANTILPPLTGGQHLSYSAYSTQGERQYMEDEYFVEQNGRFAAVFDGHGGGSVSKYLRQNLYANFQAALPRSSSSKSLASSAATPATDITHQNNDENIIGMEESTMVQQHGRSVQSSMVASALVTAFDKVDNEVGSISHWSFQGSTALAVVIHENSNNDGATTRSIVAANVGDSRAILSRGRVAIDLTKDHKPNDVMERNRIESLGGTVDWCGEVDIQGHPIEHSGVYRINGNLALSRSIGDRSERPWVTNTVDVTHYLIDEELDSFLVLATDGLYDVMSSQDVVTYIHDLMDKTTQPGRRQELRHDIAKYVAEEALRRGTADNVTVLILWIKNSD